MAVNYFMGLGLFLVLTVKNKCTKYSSEKSNKSISYSTFNSYQTGQREGWPVGTAHEQTSQNNFVEGGICTTSQETV